MSRRSGSPGDAREAPFSSSYAQADKEADNGSYAANGSIVTKLFAKTRAHVAVEDQVSDHQNGSRADENRQVKEEDGAHDDGHANGHGELEWEDDDGVEDEYLPPPSDKESEESDEESDLDDEETSMRSLLLPMATYARQLLFLSDEEDDGEFDEQDAELWESPEEKRAWIDRYEAMNRAHVEQYGCRIDAPAIPEVKKRLCRERHREAKYSLVLLVLVVFYFSRVMVGPGSVAIDETPEATTNVPATAEVHETSPTPTHQPLSQDWTPTSPPWWTVWTEDLVVRVVSWPRSVFNHYWTHKSEMHVVEEVQENEFEGAVEQDPETIVSHEIEEPNPTELSSSEATLAEQSEEIVVLEHTTEVAVSVDGGNLDKAQPVGDDDDVSSGSPSPATEHQATIAETASSNEVLEGNAESAGFVVETEMVVSEETVAISVPASDVREYPPAPAEDEVGQVNGESGVEEFQPTSDIRDQNYDRPPLQRCAELFNLVVRTKNKAEVKAEAIAACEQAISESSGFHSQNWVLSIVLRGDLRSILHSFAEAEEDYALALSSAAEFPRLADEIRIKMIANKWIGLYHTKQYKQLHEESKRHYESTVDAPDGSHELAREWYRLFRKEAALLDVLTQTRARTISRPQISQTNSD